MSGRAPGSALSGDSVAFRIAGLGMPRIVCSLPKSAGR